MIYFSLIFLQNIYRLIFLLPAGAALLMMRAGSELAYQIAKLTSVPKMITRNIKLVFPTKEASEPANRLLHNTALSIFELLCLPFFRKEHFARLAKINGEENLQSALAAGKGVLILLMHTGNYELLPPLLASRGHKLNSILKATNDPIFKLLAKSRAQGGIRLINVLEKNMYKESLAVLERNEIVGLLVDTGAMESKHEQFTFLGRKVPVATGWLTLAQRSGANILLAFSARKQGKLVYTFAPPFMVTSSNREEVKRQVAAFFEERIKAEPEQWAIFLNSYEVERMLGMRT